MNKQFWYNLIYVTLEIFRAVRVWTSDHSLLACAVRITFPHGATRELRLKG